MRHAYTPFEKDLESLVADDLKVLREASEGWYIEYKREVPKARSIAKSLAAFANTYGGWLFYGVQELSKEHPVAGAFPGVARAQVNAALQAIRQAANEHVNPAPHFEAQVLWGPCDALGMAADHGVICTRVPWSPNAPHVHKSGVIYRRVSDASEPQPENDRFLLDQLWHRGDELRRHYEEWHDRDPEFSKAESDQPYVRLLLAADLWQDCDVWLDVSVDEIRAMLGASQALVTAIPFDTVYTSADGFVGRQLAGNDPHRLSLMWRLRQTLASEVLIPLPLWTPSGLELLRLEMVGYEGVDRFVDMLVKSNVARPRVVDLNYLFNVLVGIVEIQRRLSRRAGWAGSYHAKAKLLNVWRTMPFVDVPTVLEGFERFGPPMCLDSSVTSPRGTEPGSFFEVGDCSSNDDDRLRILGQALLIFSLIARAFGLPTKIEHDGEIETELIPYLLALHQSGARSIEAQRARSQRSCQE